MSSIITLAQDILLPRDDLVYIFNLIKKVLYVCLLGQPAEMDNIFQNLNIIFIVKLVLKEKLMALIL